MNKSFHVGTYAGIPVKIHWTFILLPLWILYNLWDTEVFFIILYQAVVLALFICVILHEYGHSLAARKFGIKTFDITVTPIGGIARLDAIPSKPKQEFIIALAGPLVNVVIALLIGTFLFIKYKSLGAIIEALDQIYPENYWQAFLPMLLYYNIGLVVFNLIPAFPLDGGRVFRALLAMKWGRLKATRIAATIGQIIAIIFIGLAIWFDQLTLGFIGVFVIMMARSEYQSVVLEDALDTKTVKDITNINAPKLVQYDVIGQVIDKVKATGEKHFLVYNEDGGNFVGLLTSKGLIQADIDKSYFTAVQKYIETNTYFISADSTLRELYNSFQIHRISVLPVVDKFLNVIGTVDVNDMNQFIFAKRKPLFSFGKK